MNDLDDFIRRYKSWPTEQEADLGDLVELATIIKAELEKGE